MKSIILVILSFILLSNSVKLPNYYLVQVDRECIEDKHLVTHEWARVVRAYDSIEAKVNMLEFLERLHPAQGELKRWIIRKLNLNKYEYNVAYVRYID